MDSGRTAWSIIPRWARKLPWDLVVVLLSVLFTNAVVLVPILSATPLRIAVTPIFVTLVPGYVLLTAIFPELSLTDSADPIESVALSVGIGFFFTLCLSFALNFTPLGIRLVPVMLVISLTTCILVIVSAARRKTQQSPWNRDSLFSATTFASGGDSQSVNLLNVLLAVGVLLAVVSTCYAIVTPQQTEPYSEVYLLTEQNGEYVAGSYPTEFEPGQSESLVVAVGNHERRTINYTVVVETQRVRSQNNSTTILEKRTATTFRQRVEAGETWHHPHNISVSMSGNRIRLVYLLYRGSVPAEPTINNAHQHVSLSIDVRG